MAKRSLSAPTAIVGVGESPIGNVGVSALGLMSLAAREALDDAGMKKGDIDAVFSTESYVKPYNRLGSQFAEYFGLPSGVQYLDSCSSGSGLAGGYGAHYAAAFVASGLCDTVLVVTGDNVLSNTDRGAAVRAIAENYEREFAVPYGPVAPTRFAWMAQRYMAEYGVTRDQLSAVAVSARKWAALNPRALKREPITAADVTNSKMISTPLHMLDCSLVSDGAAALIVTREENAPDAKRRVRITGIGASFGNEEFSYDDISNAPDILVQGQRLAAERALEMADVSHEDIDIGYLYDCFSIMVLLELENLGFCEPGEAAKFVAEGSIAPGGQFPVNTHGGLLSYGHPAKPGGMFMFTEAVRQLRGEAGDAQVSGAQTCLIKGQMAHCAGHPVTILQK